MTMLRKPWQELFLQHIQIKALAYTASFTVTYQNTVLQYNAFATAGAANVKAFAVVQH